MTSSRRPLATVPAEYPPCPECGGTLSVEERFIAKPIGSFSLAGAQVKVTGTFWPHLVCDGCDLSVAAKVEEPS